MRYDSLTETGGCVTIHRDRYDSREEDFVPEVWEAVGGEPEEAGEATEDVQWGLPPGTLEGIPDKESLVIDMDGTPVTFYGLRTLSNGQKWRPRPKAYCEKCGAHALWDGEVMNHRRPDMGMCEMVETKSKPRKKAS